ncbi:MAG: S41 family peptidase [Treponema sp.]|jgi:carboxyl-terminal processing protease|nr:S41 family peptidase [Treponema sp.]
MKKIFSPWPVSAAFLVVFFALLSVPHIGAQNPFPRQAYQSIIQSVFDFIQRNYVDDVDPKTLFEGTMNGMLNSLGDPHSAFLVEREMTDLNDTTSGRFGGVGLFISKPLEAKPDGTPPFVEVASPIEDTPGWRAGINPGDLIVEIDGEATDIISMDTVLARLRGIPGTSVELKIRRGPKLEFEVTLTRAVIDVPVVKHEMIGTTAYLKIIQFTPNTVLDTKAAIRSFEESGYQNLIVDLRNNPGGLLDAAVDIGRLFFDDGVIVSTKSRIPAENFVYTADGQSVVPVDMPVIILINKGSASASEIVAGALKDRGRAYLVGEKTYGKGSVQKVYPVGGGVGFRLTTARYFTPSDVNIDKIGIPPDKEVLFPEFSAADAEKLTQIISANTIPAFVEAHPNAGGAEVNELANKLGAEYQLDTSLLRRLIRNEQNRTQIAPVYDIEYDVQLQEAVNILSTGSYRQLMQSSKTLKTLQDESKKDVPLAS